MTAVSAPFPAPRSAAATGGGLRRPLLVAVGDNVVDCYPQLGVLYPGGNAVNVAVNAARLGAPSAYIGVVGTDAAGRVVESALRSEGVDVSRLRIVEGTNAAATVHLEEGNRHFVGADTGVSRFRVNDGDLSLVGQAAIAHTGLTASAARIRWASSNTPPASPPATWWGCSSNSAWRSVTYW